jgi:iron complex outermembrane receptor protein
VRTSFPITRSILVAMLLSALQPAESRAQGQDRDLAGLPLEQLLNLEVDHVSAASRYIQDLRRAPASVTVVTRDDIEPAGYLTLADLLRGVPGVHVSDDRNYQYIGVRGFGRSGDYNSRVLILLDGHRLNEDVYDSAFVGSASPVDLSVVERVEVVKGPSSSLYGTSAFSAVVNVVTRRGGDINGTELRAEGGSFGLRSGGATFGRTFADGTELVLSGRGLGANGQSRIFFPEFASGPATGFAVDADGEAAGTVFGRVTRGRLSIAGVYGDRRKHVPTAPFGAVFNDNRLTTRDSRGFVNVRYRSALDARTDLDVSGSVDSMRYQGEYPMPVGDRALIQLDTSAGDSAGVELLLTQRRARHTLVTGGEYRYQFTIDQKLESWDGTVLELDDHRSGRRAALFVQDELSVARDVLVNLGARLDHYSSFGSTLNPRIGVIFGATRVYTAKLLYGSAFRAPNAYELYYYAEGGRFDLKPERIRTTELELSRRFGPALHATVNLFRYGIRDLITPDDTRGDERIVFTNAERADGQGVELGLAGRWANGVHASGSYSVQSVRDARTDDPLSNAPRHLAKLVLSAPLFPRRLFATTQTIYTAERRAVDGAIVPAFVRVDVNLWAPRLHRHLDLSAGVTNLFDRDYSDPGAAEHLQGAIPQKGRGAVVRATWRF